MSQIDKSIRNADVIPEIDTAVFAENPESRFALGMMAIGDEPLLGLDGVYGRAFDLRKKVYVDQTGQLTLDDVREDGTDRDDDDSRSVAFVGLENIPNMPTRIVACARLIIKGFDGSAGSHRVLPVEDFCPDVFEAEPAPTNSVEVSRMIARHDKAGIQNLLSRTMYMMLGSFVDTNRLGPTFAVVEDWYARDLKGQMPMKEIAEPRYVPHYLDYNLPIAIDGPEFARMARQSYPDLMGQFDGSQGKMVYFGKAQKPGPSSINNTPAA